MVLMITEASKQTNLPKMNVRHRNKAYLNRNLTVKLVVALYAQTVKSTIITESNYKRICINLVLKENKHVKY